ncbi:MAG: hypothetical protein WBD22_15200 [Pyrinomonadaceae bacterium]
MTEQARSAAGKQIYESHSELDKRLWSVVSFARLEAKSMTYTEAMNRLAALDSERVAGLCVVTDEAAERVRPAG